jgi:hypothetical protein
MKLKASAILTICVSLAILGLTGQYLYHLYGHQLEPFTPFKLHNCQFLGSNIENLKYNFDKRLDHYQKTTSDIRFSLYLIFIIICISIYTLVNQSKTIKIPLLDIEVSTKWLYLGAPFLLLYLWLNFGYTLYGGITSRAVLTDMSRVFDSIESKPYDSLLIKSHKKPLGELYKSDSNKKYSLVYSIEDNGILDFVFYINHDYYKATKEKIEKIYAELEFYGGFGGFFALFHLIFLIFIKYWLDQMGKEQGNIFLVVGLVTLMLLLLSHVAFAAVIPELFYVQVASLIVALLAFHFRFIKEYFKQWVMYDMDRFME